MENKIDILSIDTTHLIEYLANKDQTIDKIIDQRNTASMKNTSYIAQISKLERENKELLPYKIDFDNKLTEKVKPLFDKLNDLNNDNNILKNQNKELSGKSNQFDDFVNTIKDHYGEKYQKWHDEVFDKTTIDPNGFTRPKIKS